MRVVLLAVVGLFLGAIVGGGIGIGAGLAWTKAFNTSSFEGYSGMLVCYSFMPIGALLGALGGGIGLWHAWRAQPCGSTELTRGRSGCCGSDATNRQFEPASVQLPLPTCNSMAQSTARDYRVEIIGVPYAPSGPDIACFARDRRLHGEHHMPAAQ
jgi:hypothetical protein